MPILTMATSCASLTCKWVEWIRHARMESLRIYASVENLATITGYKYGEPEVGDSNVLRTGFDGGRYPFPRSFVFGLSVQF